MASEREENPALGWRAVRMGLDRPALLRLQLRALIAAARGRSLRVMFPLIASCDEFRAARRYVDMEIAWAARRGRPVPDTLRVGAMIEARAALHLDALLPRSTRLGRHQRPRHYCSPPTAAIRAWTRYDGCRRRRSGAPAIQRAASESGTPVSVCVDAPAAAGGLP